jgi:hypothetical protein
MASFLALLAAIPKILDLIEKAEKAFGPDWNAKLINILESHAKLQSAKTTEERDAALKAVAGGWGAN